MIVRASINLMRPKPEWVGTIKGASHYYDSPERTAGLAFEGLKMVLENAGVTDIAVDPMDWIDADLSKYNLADKYALIVPGAAPTRPEKIWPKEKYGFLCEKITREKYSARHYWRTSRKRYCDLYSSAMFKRA